jgi:hypothetical protein
VYQIFKIVENLAIVGLGWPSGISGYVDYEIGLEDDFRIIDVRMLPELVAVSPPSENYYLGTFARYR